MGPTEWVAHGGGDLVRTYEVRKGKKRQRRRPVIMSTLRYTTYSVESAPVTLNTYFLVNE